MNYREKYDYIRDSLAIGISKMADMYNEKFPKDKDFEDVFMYAIQQLREFDKLWDNKLSF